MKSALTVCAKASGLLVCLLSVAICGMATSIVVPSDSDMVIRARAIVQGRVVSINSADDSQFGISTYVTLEVQEVFKGEIAARTLVLREPGGEVEGRGQIIYGAPRFAINEDVFVYLDTWPDGSLRVHEMFLGKLSIVKDRETGRTMVIRGAPSDGADILGRSPGNITDSLELGAYADMVRGLVAIHKEESQKFEAAHYDGIRLLARPAAFGEPSEAAPIHPQFVTLNPASRWFEADTGQPIIFMTNADQAPYPQVMEDISSALDSWSSVAGRALRLISAGAAAGCEPSVGKVLIIFNNCDGRWSPEPGCSGVLAVTKTGYVTTSSKQVNGKTFYKMTQAVISFNPYASCYFSSHCRIQEVATHEIGHSLGLAHSWDPSMLPPTPTQMGATMYPVIHFDSRCASLRDDDARGINFIYPPVSAADGPIVSTGTPLSIGAQGGSYSQILAATSGALPYNWDVVEGGGELPPGMKLKPDGELIGKPSAAGRFAFTIQVTDSASRVVQKKAYVEIVDTPRITKVKYKRGKMRLIITGERLDPSVTLLVDKRAVAIKGKGAGQLKADDVSLAAGQHEIRVVTLGGVPSDPFFLKVE
ncbi:MAG TPA: matrixin family metalloprotease [Blastocatellia bacterium]|nr:matrixin family metalloprotease [Blastocatellia bacterium]